MVRDAAADDPLLYPADQGKRGQVIAGGSGSQVLAHRVEYAAGHQVGAIDWDAGEVFLHPVETELFLSARLDDSARRQ